MEKRILVTGASGFVGAYTTNKLRALSKSEGVEVFTVGRRPGADFVIDFNDLQSWEEVLKNTSPKTVIHLAGMAAPADAKSDPRAAWNVNLTATLGLASAIQRYAPKCTLVYAGSSEVYGAAFKNGVVTEASPLQPVTVYGATKAAADIALAQMHYDGLRSIRFRPMNHSGPGQSINFVLPAFASQVAKIMLAQKDPVVEVGDLSAIRDFLHVSDVSEAYILAALDERDVAIGRAFNLSSGQPVSVQYLLDKLIELSGRDISVRQRKDKMRRNEISRAQATSDEVRVVYDWAPTWSVDKLIEDVLNYWLDVENRSLN